MAICYLLQQKSTLKYSPGGNSPVNYISSWPKLWSNLKVIRTHVRQSLSFQKTWLENHPDNPNYGLCAYSNIEDFQVIKFDLEGLKVIKIWPLEDVLNKVMKDK